MCRSAFSSDSLFFQYIQQFRYSLFTKVYIAVVHNETGDAHDVVLLLKLRIVGKIIDIYSDMRIIRCDSFGCRNEVRTHGAG